MLAGPPTQRILSDLSCLVREDLTRLRATFHARKLSVQPRGLLLIRDLHVGNLVVHLLNRLLVLKLARVFSQTSTGVPCDMSMPA
jgi:hypothetical protein